MIDEAEIHRMANSMDVRERKKAVNQLRYNFVSFPDKNTAWADLIQLTQDENKGVRRKAVNALGYIFSDVPDKETVWTDLIRLTQDENKEVRRKAAGALGYVFSDVPDKETAWTDLHRLTQDENKEVRRKAAGALGYVFSVVPDKETTWADLHRLTQDENKEVRRNAAGALGYVFSDVPDKETAWADLHRLTQDENKEVRRNAAGALGHVFSDVPDKETAWADLHRLTQDENKEVRRNAAGVLGSCFSAVPDKATVWADLHRLTQDVNKEVRRNAAGALGYFFYDVPDKETAWADLHRLTQDENEEVRRNAAGALGSCFAAVPDKATAWVDLIRLTQDENEEVRMYAYHSLGSASVYKATETGDEEKFRDELKKAIEYFEQSSNEAEDRYYNPAQFCLPFYLSYYAVISGKQEAEPEAAKYLDEAKKATGISESRKALLKAVENLANALKEAQKPLEFGETKDHLRACRQYCDHTAELADSARGKSPVAAAAIERGIPIVGVKVKEIIAEIQKKAEALCKQTKDTPYEELGKEVNQIGQNISKVINQDKLGKCVRNLLIPLSAICEKMPDGDQKDAYEMLERLKSEGNVEDQLNLVNMIISKISSQMTKSEQKPKESSFNIFDGPATIGAFIGFLTAEIGTYFYPITYNHLVSVVIAVLVFIAVAISNRQSKN